MDIICQNACKCGNGANKRTVCPFYIHRTVLFIAFRLHLQHTPKRTNFARSHVFQDPDNVRNSKWRLVVIFPLDLLISAGRYSLTSRLQKRFIRCCRRLHILEQPGIWLSNSHGGRGLNGLKGLDMRGISLSGRSATSIRGGDIRMASLSNSIA